MPTRHQKIQEWEGRVHADGATVYDVAELEKILRRAIILKDIAGEDIYNSGMYQRGGNGVRGKVELICHNGHAWPKDIHFSQSRKVHIYESDVWQAIQEAIRGEPVAVWLLGGQDRQLSVDQFVLQDSRTYRTREAHERLQAICAKQGRPDLAERAFGEKPRGQHRGQGKEWLEANPSQPPPRRREGLWNSMNYDTREVVSIDMKACYPASFHSMGEAKPYFERFGHPTHRMARVAINGALAEDIGTGFAEIQEWE